MRIVGVALNIVPYFNILRMKNHTGFTTYLHFTWQSHIPKNLIITIQFTRSQSRCWCNSHW